MQTENKANNLIASQRTHAGYSGFTLTYFRIVYVPFVPAQKRVTVTAGSFETPRSEKDFISK